jgi:hypothetical protein
VLAEFGIDIRQLSTGGQGLLERNRTDADLLLKQAVRALLPRRLDTQHVVSLGQGIFLSSLSSQTRVQAPARRVGLVCVVASVPALWAALTQRLRCDRYRTPRPVFSIQRPSVLTGVPLAFSIQTAT